MTDYASRWRAAALAAAAILPLADARDGQAAGHQPTIAELLHRGARYHGLDPYVAVVAGDAVAFADPNDQAAKAYGRGLGSERSK